MRQDNANDLLLIANQFEALFRSRTWRVARLLARASLLFRRHILRQGVIAGLRPEELVENLRLAALDHDPDASPDYLRKRQSLLRARDLKSAWLAMWVRAQESESDV